MTFFLSFQNGEKVNGQGDMHMLQLPPVQGFCCLKCDCLEYYTSYGIKSHKVAILLMCNSTECTPTTLD